MKSEPAFPALNPVTGGGPQGISKLDWMATQIMQAVVIASAVHDNRRDDRASFWSMRDYGGGAPVRVKRMVKGKEVEMDIFDVWCCETYEVAEAMLKESNLRTEGGK